MPIRKVPLVKNELYHIYNKSIADFRIFDHKQAYDRMVETIDFYKADKPACKFSLFKELKEKGQLKNFDMFNRKRKIVEIIAYCFMPTHFHLILKALTDFGITDFVNRISNSYARYFNLKYRRKGPLWEGRFKNVLVETDSQLEHLTRYIHLNPVTSKIVNKPEDWQYSSYAEYIGQVKERKKICTFTDYVDMDTESLKKFTNDQIDYQRQLHLIKHLTLE